MENLKGFNNIDTTGLTGDDRFHSAGANKDDSKEKALLSSMPSDLQSFWDVFLLLIAYICMGGFLTLTLAKDLVLYLLG